MCELLKRFPFPRDYSLSRIKGVGEGQASWHACLSFAVMKNLRFSDVPSERPGPIPPSKGVAVHRPSSSTRETTLNNVSAWCWRPHCCDEDKSGNYGNGAGERTVVSASKQVTPISKSEGPE